jgi:hypothetical protein
LVVGAINTPQPPHFKVSKFSAFKPHTRALDFIQRHKQEIKSSTKSKDHSNQIVTSERDNCVHLSSCAWIAFCRRFDPGGSLDRRVNYRRVSQPRWVSARRSTKGGREQAKGKPAAFVLPCAQVGCACSRGLQVSAWERARNLRVGPFSRAANLPVESPGPSFYRRKERVQVYNEGCSSVLTCLAERS